jgi:hypothetical protein
MRGIGVTVGLAALMLADGAPGDWRLGDSDIAARARGSWVVESVQHPIAYHQSAEFTLPCLDGTTATQGNAKITNVDGTWNRPQDYSISSTVDAGARKVSALVTHIGAQHYDDDPVVVVEMRAYCRAPAKG